MKYRTVTEGIFVSRPNRFTAKALINGIETTVHVKNTGRCRELLVPGARIYLEDFEGCMGMRKLRYSLIAVEKKRPEGALLINMDSQAPNKVAGEGLKDGRVKVSGLGELSLIRPETVYGNSRFDFYVEDKSGKKAFLEVKGCTLEDGGACSFPDAPTERGVKHLEELIKAKKEGYAAAVLFVIQMEGMKYFTPADELHGEFGRVLRKAAAEGVQVLAMECRVLPDELWITKPVKIRL